MRILALLLMTLSALHAAEDTIEDGNIWIERFFNTEATPPFNGHITATQMAVESTGVQDYVFNLSDGTIWWIRGKDAQSVKDKGWTVGDKIELRETNWNWTAHNVTRGGEAPAIPGDDYN